MLLLTRFRVVIIGSGQQDRVLINSRSLKQEKLHQTTPAAGSAAHHALFWSHMWTGAEPPHTTATLFWILFWVNKVVHEPNESRQHRPHISHIWYTKSVSRNLNERPVFGTMLPDHGLPISGSLFTSGKRAALHRSWTKRSKATWRNLATPQSVARPFQSVAARDTLGERLSQTSRKRLAFPFMNVH